MWQLRSKPDEEDVDCFPASPRKEWSMKFVSALVNFARCYTSQTELFFPRKMCTENCDEDCLIRPSCYPNEHYIPTYMNMWLRESLAEFIEAIRNNGTAGMYISRPTSICFLFARKFAPSALRPLLTLPSWASDVRFLPKDGLALCM